VEIWRCFGFIMGGFFLFCSGVIRMTDWHTHIHTEENRYHPSEENQELAK
jgi:hypothetical protein